MRRIIIAILFFLMWLLLIQICIPVIRINLPIGIFFTFAFTLLMILGYISLEVFSDNDSSEKRYKEKAFQYDNSNVSYWNIKCGPVQIIIKRPKFKFRKNKKKNETGDPKNPVSQIQRGHKRSEINSQVLD